MNASRRRVIKHCKIGFEGEVRSANGVTNLSLIDIMRCVKKLQFEELCMLKKKKQGKHLHKSSRCEFKMLSTVVFLNTCSFIPVIS